MHFSSIILQWTPPHPNKKQTKPQQQHIHITTLNVLMMTATQLGLICVSEERFVRSRLSFGFKQDSPAPYMYQNKLYSLMSAVYMYLAIPFCCYVTFPNIPCVCIYKGLLWKLENYEFEGPFLRFQTISSRTQCVLIGHSVSSLECLWQKNQYLDLCCSLFV